MSRRQRIAILRGYVAAVLVTIASPLFFGVIASLVPSDWYSCFSMWLQQLSLMDIVSVVGNFFTAIFAWRYFAKVVRQKSTANKTNSIGSCIKPPVERYSASQEAPITTMSIQMNRHPEIDVHQYVRTRSGT